MKTNDTTKKIHILCVPFTSLTMPSLEISTLKAVLKEHDVDAEILTPFYDYACSLGGDVYCRISESIVGQAIFSALLFPHHQPALEKGIGEHMPPDEFRQHIQNSECFCREYADGLAGKLKESDIVLFHLYVSQLFPALYLAKLLYEKHGVQVWFSGHHCQGQCGESLQALFPFIRQVIGRDLEHRVLQLLGQSGLAQPHQMWEYPTPDYDDFGAAMNRLPAGFKKEHVGHFWLQVEFSRGCWWNQCSFCTLNCQWSSFAHKSVDGIIRDYKSLLSTYQTTQILVNEFNSDDQWENLIRRLNEEFPGMRGTYYLLFKVSAVKEERAMQLLAENHIPILVGVESFAKDYLRLINKGHRVIESIQLLKFAERHHVNCSYNIMFSLPFEREEDYDETKRVISYIKHLVPPFDLEVFRLTYGSPIYNNPDRYGIERMMLRKDYEGLLLPAEIHDHYTPFFYDFDSVNPGIREREARWRELIQGWIDLYYADARKGQSKLHCLLYKRQWDNVLDIYDAREGKGYHVHTLWGVERALYEYCDQVREYRDIIEQFSTVEESCLQTLLDAFVSQKLMFKEDANYLSLAV
ncbi:radical SAM protein [Desulfitobacterium chlororespirans]|uniref:Radical SAM superfamily protein n=1 Tax=Desulfitobacterium chlororespirans DSM 11544 TaxID=1121395 RepID=A0A1M7UKD1_9FIRM|nr:radical SAM protein [Desulfitobacterium chlororespirans]SHN83482.1 Radical SAM superfamily protein [Desulfitobacterium chlororespirans DSM 11544]